MTSLKLTAFLLVSSLALAACGDDPARTQARKIARRNSCVAAELALQAKEKLASLDTASVSAEGGPLQQAVAATRTFAATYRAWADANSRAMDLADSAAFARSRQDSLRLAREAGAARPTAPRDQVQMNAMRSYTHDFDRAANNPDHPCNRPEDEQE